MGDAAYLDFASVMGGPEPEDWFTDSLARAAKLADELALASDDPREFRILVRLHVDGPLWPLDFEGVRLGRLQRRDRMQVVEVAVPPELRREPDAACRFLAEALRRASAVVVGGAPSTRSFQFAKAAVDRVARRLEEEPSG